MLVWRIETADGRGPIHVDGLLTDERECRLSDGQWGFRWPSPVRDIPGWEIPANMVYGLSEHIAHRREHYFGFTSLRMGRDWFSLAERLKLNELGYAFRAYHNPVSVLVGSRQIAFKGATPGATRSLISNRETNRYVHTIRKELCRSNAHSCSVSALPSR